MKNNSSKNTNSSNNEISLNKTFKDASDKFLFRNSALSRIVLGTTSTTLICFLYSLAHARYRNFHFSFVKNWLKGSLTFSFLFYTGNELLFACSNYYKVYTNFWVNYSLLAYNLSKVHYRYLIRNNLMKWYLAIKFSHKCFMYLLVINLVIELFLKLSREVYLYNEEDVFDKLREKFKDKETNLPLLNMMTYGDLEQNFMKPFHVFNSDEKNKIVKKNARYSKNSNERSIWTGNLRIKTVDLYEMYKRNKI